MKRGILTAAFLMASAGFASADYVIIVANVGGTAELKSAGFGGMPGMGMPGGRGGMSGLPGGGPPGMGMRGSPSMPPGGGMPGMGNQGGGMGGATGMRGVSGGGPSMPGMPGGGGPSMPGGGGPSMPGGRGMQGGSPPGMGMSGGPPMPPGGGMPGMGNQGGGMRPGGMAGMGGAMYGGMGMCGGMPGGMMGMGGGLMGMLGLGSTDTDDIPDYVIAVIEVNPTRRGANILKNLLSTGIVPVKLPERLGKSCQLLATPPFGKIYVITEEGKPLPAVSVRFQQKFDSAIKEKASASDLLSVAEWALEHGLVGKFATVMDEVAKADKANSAAVAYLKVKADLDRNANDDPLVATWRDRLLDRYKATETPHYVIVHNSAHDTAVEIKTHADHLENSIRGFYYWFALRGIALPVPRTRQVVVLTSKPDDFESLRKILSSGPLVVDGFFARRESLAVMHAQRQDDPYKALNTFWDNWSGKGYKRFEILQGTPQGMPKNGVPLDVKAAATLNAKALVQIAEAQMLALMLKALEQEAELATVSHEASRQLLFASGLLPRNVAAPEWLLFGMGSFFETPLQSPWPTIGAPSPYYLPRWRELKSKEAGKGGLEATAVETLRKVVGDGYFRTLPSEGKPGTLEHYQHEPALRKARTIAWSLAYFLTQKHLGGMRRYFTELSKMPRDVELDDTILLGCFARAFGCVDANNKVDEAKLKTLAAEWYSYWQSVHFESESIMKDIRDTIAKEVKAAQEKLKKDMEEGNSQQGFRMFPGMNRGGSGLPPGMIPPGGSPPGNQRPGGTPPSNQRPGGRSPSSPTSPKR